VKNRIHQRENETTMNLTPEQREIGKQNFQEAVGSTRREFLLGTVLAGGTAFGASMGANYFGYGTVDDRLRVGVIGTGDEGGVLIGGINPDYIDVKSVADIRSFSRHRALHGDNSSDGTLKARPGLMNVYGWTTEDQARDNLKIYSGGYEELIDNAEADGVEAVIIAVPLHLHDAAAIYAMQKGLHVLTEKLMAHSVAQCKEMARVARDTDTILATGHQRHYSVLYDNAVDQIRRGLLGEIHHIRAQWQLAVWFREFELQLRDSRAQGQKAIDDHVAEYPLYAKLRSWRGRLKNAKGAEIDVWAARVRQLEEQIMDQVQDGAEKHGYQANTLANGIEISPLEELIRWRLWDRTGGGLMAELGSHQLDAASIFLTAQRTDGKKARPLSVSGMGQRALFPLDREVDDHVHCMFEFPLEGYVDDPNRKCVVSYSSINGNGFGGWGEVVLGTKGTLILDQEQEALLFKGSDTSSRIAVKPGSAEMDTYETGGGGGAALAQAATPADISRGYREEIEHWAWCVKNRDPENQPRCKPEVALADAVIALTSNIAIRENRRIMFEDEWFDIASDATPEGAAENAQPIARDAV
jgi:predicted dehydrogenase